MARAPVDEPIIKQKYGTPLKYDPNFNGPNKHRSCTDILCLLLFVVFIAAWAVLGFFAFKWGDINRLLLPTDSMGRRCGDDSEVLSKPYLFFFDLTKCATPDSVLNGCQTPQICVADCPNDFWIAQEFISGPFDKNVVQSHLKCTDDSVVATVVDGSTLKSVIDNNFCASYYLPSYSLYNRCIPSLINLNQTIKDLMDKYHISIDMLSNSTEVVDALMTVNKISENVMHDLNATWRYLVIGLLVALFVSLIYIFLLRYVAGIMVWLSILALIVLLTGGTYISYKNYVQLRDTGVPVVQQGTHLKGKLQSVLNKQEFWVSLLVIFAVLLVLTLVIVIFLRKRISIAVTLIREGSKAVSNVMSALFFPIFPWILQCLVIGWAGIVAVYLMSSEKEIFKVHGLANNQLCVCSNAYVDNDNCTPQEFNKYCQNPQTLGHCLNAGCGYVGQESSSKLTYMHLYNLFGMFWGIWFISGMSQLILAIVFSTWYWTFRKRDVPFFTLTRAIFITLWYHLGTVAFGSLIIAICSFIRAMIEFAEQKIKKYDNAFTKAIFCCLRCFFWCLHKFLCFVNRNAYIMCAVHGKNFCSSAKNAFELLMRNVIRVVVVDKVTDFVFFLGKAFITAGMVVAAYNIFTRPVRLLDNSGRDVYLNYPWLPIVIVGFITYVVASIFFSVYSMAVDTLFLCFLEDCERNDGSQEKPYFMSKQLMQILGKKNAPRNKNR